MYAKILVPIEMSHKDSGAKAISIAKELVDEGGDIILVNVVDEVPSYVKAELPMEFLKNSEAQAYENLNKIAKDQGIDTPVEIGKGNAATAILALAKSHQIDLIVVASHRPGFTDYFLGSTAARIVRHAQCPVLVDR